MCGCEYHYNADAPCTCTCPEHANIVRARNWFQGAASETEPPEATFDLIGEHVPASRPIGLESLLCALAVIAWACAPAVVVHAWRGARR